MTVDLIRTLYLYRSKVISTMTDKTRIVLIFLRIVAFSVYRALSIGRVILKPRCCPSELMLDTAALIVDCSWP